MTLKFDKMKDVLIRSKLEFISFQNLSDLDLTLRVTTEWLFWMLYWNDYGDKNNKSNIETFPRNILHMLSPSRKTECNKIYFLKESMERIWRQMCICILYLTLHPRHTLHIFQSNYDSVLIGILSSNRALRTYRNVRPKIVFSCDSTQKIPNFTCTTSAM